MGEVLPSIGVSFGTFILFSVKFFFYICFLLMVLLEPVTPVWNSAEPPLVSTGMRAAGQGVRKE